MSKKEQIILGFFSFYGPMTFSQLILDLDARALVELGDFTKEDLETTIKSLEKQKLLKRVSVDKEVGWVRVHRKKAWWKRFF